MKRRHFLAALGATAIIPPPSARPQQPPAPAPKPEGPVRRVLPSGLRVVVVERPDQPLVALELWVRFGSGDEPPARVGIAHLIEHLVFKGSENKKPGSYDAVVEGLGGEITARTLRDATQYATVVASSGWSEALAQLAEMVLRPAFRSDDLTAEKPVLLGELALARTEPLRAGLAAVCQALYTEAEPYHFPPNGLPALLETVTPDDLRALHAASYRPTRMTLVVTGAVSATDVLRRAEQLFAGPRLTPVARPLRQALATPAASDGYRAPADPIWEKRALTTVVLGWRLPPAADVATGATIAVLQELLASGEQGRLAGPILVQQKLALSLSLEWVVQRAGCVLAVVATTTPNQVESLERGILDQLHRILEDSFPEAEVEQGRRSALARIAAEEATVDGQARRIAFHDALDVPGLEDELKKQIPMVGADSLVALLRRYLRAADRAVALVGPAPHGGAQ